MKKELSERGKKSKAGMLLSSYLKQIANEQTECICGTDGDDRMATKAEKLARIIWEGALGCKDTKIVHGERVDVIIPPDRSMINLIFDRIEGRAPMSTTDPRKKPTVSERITEQGKQRIERAGGLGADS